MDSLPTWAVWSIVAASILLSPLAAFLLAMAALVMLAAVVDTGAPAWIVLGAAIGGLILSRALRKRSATAHGSATAN